MSKEISIRKQGIKCPHCEQEMGKDVNLNYETVSIGYSKGGRSRSPSSTHQIIFCVITQMLTLSCLLLVYFTCTALLSGRAQSHGTSLYCLQTQEQVVPDFAVYIQQTSSECCLGTRLWYMCSRIWYHATVW